MGLVDLLCVGKLGPAAIGAVGIGTAVFGVFMVIGIGLLSGMDFLTAFHFGRKEPAECRRVLLQSLWLSTAYSAVGTGIIFILAKYVPYIAKDPEQSSLATEYLKILAFSLWPAVIFANLRQYLQALGNAFPGMLILFIANAVNLFGNLAFIFGRYGFPALGTSGSAWATLISRVFMVLCLFIYLLWYDRDFFAALRPTGFGPNKKVIQRLLEYGIPSATQFGLEVGVFALSTLLAARFGAISSAAHQAVLNTASLTFMVPLGISFATAVLVGQSLGRDDRENIRHMGNFGLLLGGGFMTLSCIFLFLFAGSIIHGYSSNAEVISLGRKVLWIAAIFQLSDGIQVVGTGALRGLGQTKFPMMANLIGHWFIGLPLGLVLAYVFKMELLGIWIGLSVGLGGVAALLYWKWDQEVKKIKFQFTSSI